MEHVKLWAQFLGWSVAVVIAGVRLVHYGDVLSEKLKLGKALVGMLLIGWATSLPEMVLSASAVLWLTPPSPEMAVGNIFGSLAFNLGILAIFALILHKSVGHAPSPRTVPLSAAYSMLLVGVMMAALGLSYASIPIGHLWAVSTATWLILAIYAYSTWALYREDKKGPSEDNGEPEYAGLGLGATIAKALAASAVIVVAGVFLAHTGDSMSALYGLSKSVVGIFFLAVVSSLPELATTIAALKKGYFDMAAGNIFGSNIFNVAIVALCDLLHRPGPIFKGLRREEMPQQLTAGAITLLITGVFFIGLVLRRRRAGAAAAGAKVRPEMVIGAVLYVAGMLLLLLAFRKV